MLNNISNNIPKKLSNAPKYIYDVYFDKDYLKLIGGSCYQDYTYFKKNVNNLIIFAGDWIVTSIDQINPEHFYLYLCYVGKDYKAFSVLLQCFYLEDSNIGSDLFDAADFLNVSYATILGTIERLFSLDDLEIKNTPRFIFNQGLRFDEHSKGILRRLEMFNERIKSITINEEERLITVVFENGDVTQQKCSEEDIFNPYIGVALCIAQQMYGSKNEFRKFVKNHSKTVGRKYKKEAKIKRKEKAIEKAKKLAEEAEKKKKEKLN